MVASHDDGQASAASGKPQRGWGDIVFAICVTVGFSALVLVGLHHHEIWRDEAKAWLIARDSASLAELYFNRRYEGHPIGWYALLWIASRVSRDPIAMGLTHAAIATATVATVVWFAPFSRLQKALFALGVFPLYEHGVVSRNYAQGALLLFLAVTLFTSRQRRPIAVAVVLFLMANSSLYGLLISAAMAITWAARECIDRWWTTELASVPLFHRNNVLAALIVLGGFAASFYQIIPPPPAIATSEEPRLSAFSEERFTGRSLEEAIGTVWRGYLPIPLFTTSDTFYTSITDALPKWPRRVVVLFGSIVLGGSALLLVRRSGMAALFFVTASGMLVGLSWWKFMGSMRHHGHLYLVLLAALWIAWPTLVALQYRRRFTAIALTSLLAIHAGLGLYYLSQDIRRPFSPSRSVARMIESRYGRDVTLISEPGHYTSGLLAYLDVSTYYPVRGEFRTFELIDGTAKRASPEQLAAALQTVMATADRPTLLISDTPVTSTFSGIRLVLQGSLGPTLSRESYSVYSVYADRSTEAPSTQPTTAPSR